MLHIRFAFVALRVAKELNKSLCYKLIIFGIPLDELAKSSVTINQCSRMQTLLNRKSKKSTIRYTFKRLENVLHLLYLYLIMLIMMIIFLTH